MPFHFTVKFQYPLIVSDQMYILKQEIVIEQKSIDKAQEENKKSEKKTHRFLVLLRKMKEKRLRRSYQMNINHYLYPKNYNHSISTFSFNMHHFNQKAYFHLIDTFSINRHIFIQQTHFQSINTFNIYIQYEGL